MAGNMKLLDAQNFSLQNILSSHVQNCMGLHRRARHRKKKLLQGAHEISSSGENVQQVVVEAVKRLGGIKKATPEAMVDELIDYQGLNLVDVYKHMQMLQRPTTSEGKEIWKGNTSKKEPERTLSGVLNQKSSASKGSKDAVRQKFMAKLKGMASSADEVEDLSEAVEKMWQFCTLFPYHCEFEKDTLIQLWIAAGFLKGEHKGHLGEFYFRTLLDNDYITNARTWSPTDKDKYIVNTNKMKDDYSTNTMSDKELYLTLKNLYNHKASKEVQYVSLVGDDIDEESLEKLIGFKDLKALMLISEDVSSISKIPHNVFSALKHLEVLDLSRTSLVELPNSIGDLIELKYLDLSLTLIELLPETLDCLSKLQTLKLKDCRHLFRLPEGMSKLTSLKHLELDVLGQLAFMPRGMGTLTELETLSTFLVHKDDGRSIKELKNMNNLKGSFCISSLENASDPLEVEKAAMCKKKYLKELELRWSDFHQQRNEPQDQYQILQKLCPNSILDKLQISCYGGTSFPSWIGSDPSLNMLTSVTLFKCDNSEILPSLGKLPSLKFLSLVEMNSVREIGTKFRGFDTSVAFPRLERLAVVGFSKLERWKEVEKGDYPCLSKLTIERCPELVVVPSSLFKLYTLKHLEIINCGKLTSLLEKNLSNSLVNLIIEECPSITELFQNRKGKNLHKFEHVQNVWVDHQMITRD